MSATTTAAPQAPQSIGAVGRVIGAIVNPRATFEDIARKPSWLVPLLVLIIVNISLLAIFGQRVGWRSMIEKQNAQNASMQSRMDQMTPEQRQRTENMQVKLAPIFAYVGTVIFIPLMAVIVAAILMGIFNATSSAELKFKTSFGIVSHAYLPGVIGLLLGILVLFLKPPDQVDLQNLVASNVGALLSSDSPKWLISLGSSIDVFSFWVIGLMGFGFSVARPKKISTGSAVAWIVALWAIYVIVKVGITFAFS